MSSSPPAPPISPPPPSYHSVAYEPPESLISGAAATSTASASSLTPVLEDSPPDSSSVIVQGSHAIPSPVPRLPRSEEVILQWTPPHPEPSTQTHVGPITYSFSQLGYNTMLLLPPPEQLDSRPLYHITVEMNCLRPASYVTVLRRGSSERGPYVGEFECHSVPRAWINSRYDRVTLGSVSKLLREPTIRWENSRDRGLTWNILHWKFGQLALQWHHIGGWRPEKTIIPQCTMSGPGIPKGRGVLLATLQYSDPAKTFPGERPVTKIEITRKGREPELIDHVIMTALILQRDLWD